MNDAQGLSSHTNHLSCLEKALDMRKILLKCCRCIYDDMIYVFLLALYMCGKCLAVVLMFDIQQCLAKCLAN